MKGDIGGNEARKEKRLRPQRTKYRQAEEASAERRSKIFDEEGRSI